MPTPVKRTKEQRKADRQERRAKNKAFREEMKYLNKLDVTEDKDLRPQDRAYLEEGNAQERKEWGKKNKLGAGAMAALMAFLAHKSKQMKNKAD